MKIVVLPFSSRIGGSEINAIELAGAVRRLGHDVALIAPPGPAIALAKGWDLRIIEARYQARLRPSPAAIREIRGLISREAPDVVHAYEAHVCTEAFYALGVLHRPPLVGTIYGMSVDAYMPRSFPVIAGTAELAAELSISRPAEAIHRLDPPVDAAANAPNAEAGRLFREQLGLASDEIAVVAVSRLDVWMKLDGLMDAVDAADALARDWPVRLVIVGDGPARDALSRRAEKVNAAHGHDVVLLVGPLMDPRPAYCAADVVVGMGTSLLRGLATGKPAVLVGELGFVRAIGPTTVAAFLQQGFWGVGDGTRGTERLRLALADVFAMTAQERADLGEFGRDLVVQRFGLEASAVRLLEIYEAVRRWSPNRRQAAMDAVLAPGLVAARKIRDRRPSRRRAEQRMLSGGPDVTDYESVLATPRERVERFWRSRSATSTEDAGAQ